MIAERSGPLLGAMVVTLPIAAGPAYLFLSLEHGPDFIAASALGSLVTTAANGVFGLVYAALAQRRGLPASFGGALVAWFILSAVLRATEWTLVRALLLNAATYAVCVPPSARFREAVMPIYLRRWYDVPLRAALVCGVVTAVLGLSAWVGPVTTGILATAPVAMTSIALILQPRVGGQVTGAVISNGLIGLVGFALALTVLHLCAQPLGSAAALVLWLAASMGWNLAIWTLRARVTM